MTDSTQPARWYMVNKMGMATLCNNKKDAAKEARAMDMAWPHMGPHRAVQLVEVDSIAASAWSEPVAWQYRSVRNKGMWFDCTEERAKQRAAHPETWEVRYLCTPPISIRGSLVAERGSES